ncbi:hypothetical protein K488DRAFT_15600, partial [Vararia minispora EC-137]
MNLFLVLAFLVSAAGAQNIQIGYPSTQAKVTRGSTISVQVNRPNSLTGSQEVAVVISLASCVTATCNSSQRLGTILYSGPYDPQYPASRTPRDEPQQNFTVTVPAGLQPGPASLSVVHLSLVG